MAGPKIMGFQRITLRSALECGGKLMSASLVQPLANGDPPQAHPPYSTHLAAGRVHLPIPPPKKESPVRGWANSQHQPAHIEVGMVAATTLSLLPSRPEGRACYPSKGSFQRGLPLDSPLVWGRQGGLQEHLRPTSSCAFGLGHTWAKWLQ